MGVELVCAQSSTSLDSSGYINKELDRDDWGAIYHKTLTGNITYRIKLEIDATADFDLYVFHLNPTTNQNYTNMVYSEDPDDGADEVVEFTPSFTDKVAIVVLRRSGSGLSGNLWITEVGAGGIPGFEIALTAFSLLTLLGVSLVLIRRRSILSPIF